MSVVSSAIDGQIISDDDLDDCLVKVKLYLSHFGTIDEQSVDEHVKTRINRSLRNLIAGSAGEKLEAYGILVTVLVAFRLNPDGVYNPYRYDDTDRLKVDAILSSALPGQTSSKNFKLFLFCVAALCTPENMIQLVKGMPPAGLGWIRQFSWTDVYRTFQGTLTAALKSFWKHKVPFHVFQSIITPLIQEGVGPLVEADERQRLQKLKESLASNRPAKLKPFKPSTVTEFIQGYYGLSLACASMWTFFFNNVDKSTWPIQLRRQALKLVLDMTYACVPTEDDTPRLGKTEREVSKHIDSMAEQDIKTLPEFNELKAILTRAYSNDCRARTVTQTYYAAAPSSPERIDIDVDSDEGAASKKVQKVSPARMAITPRRLDTNMKASTKAKAEIVSEQSTSPTPSSDDDIEPLLQDRNWGVVVNGPSDHHQVGQIEFSAVAAPRQAVETTEELLDRVTFLQVPPSKTSITNLRKAAQKDIMDGQRVEKISGNVLEVLCQRDNQLEEAVATYVANLCNTNDPLYVFNMSWLFQHESNSSHQVPHMDGIFPEGIFIVNIYLGFYCPNADTWSDIPLMDTDFDTDITTIFLREKPAQPAQSLAAGHDLRVSGALSDSKTRVALSKLQFAGPYVADTEYILNNGALVFRRLRQPGSAVKFDLHRHFGPGGFVGRCLLNCMVATKTAIERLTNWMSQGNHLWPQVNEVTRIQLIGGLDIAAFRSYFASTRVEQRRTAVDSQALHQLNKTTSSQAACADAEEPQVGLELHLLPHCVVQSYAQHRRFQAFTRRGPRLYEGLDDVHLGDRSCKSCNTIAEILASTSWKRADRDQDIIDVLLDNCGAIAKIIENDHCIYFATITKSASYCGLHGFYTTRACDWDSDYFQAYRDLNKLLDNISDFGIDLPRGIIRRHVRRDELLDIQDLVDVLVEAARPEYTMAAGDTKKLEVSSGTMSTTSSNTATKRKAADHQALMKRSKSNVEDADFSMHDLPFVEPTQEDVELFGGSPAVTRRTRGDTSPQRLKATTPFDDKIMRRTFFTKTTLLEKRDPLKQTSARHKTFQDRCAYENMPSGALDNFFGNLARLTWAESRYKRTLHVCCRISYKWNEDHFDLNGYIVGKKFYREVDCILIPWIHPTEDAEQNSHFSLFVATRSSNRITIDCVDNLKTMASLKEYVKGLKMKIKALVTQLWTPERRVIFTFRGWAPLQGIQMLSMTECGYCVCINALMFVIKGHPIELTAAPDFAKFVCKILADPDKISDFAAHVETSTSACASLVSESL